MKLVEILKSNYLIRLIIYLILTLIGLGLILYSSAHGKLFMLSIFLIFYGIHYIISDLLMIKDRKKITPVESKSKRLLWVVIIAIIPISIRIFLDNSESNTEWSALFLCIAFIGAIQTIREDSIVTDNSTIERLGFLTGAKMKWSEVSEIIRDSGKITIQSTRKDYILIDIKKSTEREIRLIEETLRQAEKHYAQ